MPRYPKANSEAPEPRPRPATTPEAREQQLIAAAVDLAEKQLLDGTASAQVIAHFLKLGSSREALEQKKIALETELAEAKTQNLKDQKNTAELYMNALNAMREYAGYGSATVTAGDEDYSDA